jgi:hypothetical protein
MGRRSRRRSEIDSEFWEYGQGGGTVALEHSTGALDPAIAASGRRQGYNTRYDATESDFEALIVVLMMSRRRGLAQERAEVDEVGQEVAAQ